MRDDLKEGKDFKIFKNDFFCGSGSLVCTMALCFLWVLLFLYSHGNKVNVLPSENYKKFYKYIIFYQWKCWTRCCKFKTNFQAFLSRATWLVNLSCLLIQHIPGFSVVLPWVDGSVQWRVYFNVLSWISEKCPAFFKKKQVHWFWNQIWSASCNKCSSWTKNSRATLWMALLLLYSWWPHNQERWCRSYTLL